jgi:uncharacterized membrane protein (DUF485 family)
MTPMLAIYSVFFSGLMLLAGFARPLMAAAIWEPLDVGYTLIIATFLMCWALALVYVFAADRAFDPRSRAVARNIESLASRRYRPSRPRYETNGHLIEIIWDQESSNGQAGLQRVPPEAGRAPTLRG